MVRPIPTKKPEWNTGGSNRTEPTAGKKVTGWSLNDQPPSSYFNWLQYYTYDWFEWLNERFDKGTAEVDLIVQALQPDTPGDGGDLDLFAGNALTSGAGGDVQVTAGIGIGSEGGDVTISAGTSDTDGGDARVFAGDNTTSGIAGNVRLQAGDATSGAGGAANVQAGAGTTNGGALTLTAGNTDTSGAGGAVTVTAGSATTGGSGGAISLDAGDGAGVGAGGNITLDAGDAGTDGAGGDVTISAGAGTNGNEGGDVSITAGQSTDTNGGDATLGAGAAAGTDQTGGTANIRTGASTGTAGASIFVKVAESETGGSGSGTYANNPIDYMTFSGVNKQVNVNRHLRLDNSSDTTRGAMRLTQQAQPTSPTKGDTYLDSGTEQVRIRDSNGYRAVNPLFGAPWANSNNMDDTVTERAYVTSGPTNILYTIPAGYLSTGSILRMVARFARSGTAADEPGFKFRIGPVGSHNGGAVPTGTVVGYVTPVSGGATLDNFFVQAEVYITAAGSPGTAECVSAFWGKPSSLDWQAPNHHNLALGSLSIDTTVALEVFPSVDWFAVGTGLQWSTLSYFSLDVI